MSDPRAGPMDPARIRQAAAALKAGYLVVLPTETVYGLGANAMDPEAVARIFEAKGRPADNPLIVHVADLRAAAELADPWPTLAQRLAERFWPGPLTLVVPKASTVPDVTTAGLDTVAVRVPGHPLARELLAIAGVPVAAPSANTSGRPSPTRVEHARDDLGDAVAVYLDGGPTDVGVESTVVDVCGDHPIILRPGGIPREAIEAIAGPTDPSPSQASRSPGIRHRHYAPRTRVHLRAPDQLPGEVARRLAAGETVGVIAGPATAGKLPSDDPHLVLIVPGPRDDAQAWAKELFASLRELDRREVDAILIERPPGEGLGEAILDRLNRAAEGSRDA
ncbi:MAG: L-threonylcarbamoyladenylate synthase [Candidatus Thermoplasmatota archaeon]|nr:L-threonylcarbamoyladenylate synthase [Candidatus Thermoplasmatota archaeon]